MLICQITFANLILKNELVMISKEKKMCIAIFFKKKKIAFEFHVAMNEKP